MLQHEIGGVKLQNCDKLPRVYNKKLIKIGASTERVQNLDVQLTMGAIHQP